MKRSSRISIPQPPRLTRKQLDELFTRQELDPMMSIRDGYGESFWWYKGLSYFVMSIMFWSN
jgi:hypothetical protein